MSSGTPEEYRAEADLCRKRAGACTDPKIAHEWQTLATEYDRLAQIVEPSNPAATNA
jgi:hypothetical protein